VILFIHRALVIHHDVAFFAPEPTEAHHASPPTIRAGPGKGASPRCTAQFREFKHRADRNLRSMQRRSTLVQAFGQQATLF
jgi:hypothetical protein